MAHTGRCDDFLLGLARAEGGELPHPRGAAGLLGGLVGAGAAALARLLPGRLAARLQNRGFAALVPPARRRPFDPAAGPLRRAAALLSAASAGGRTPALLCLTSHPPAHGDALPQTVELMRHALLALETARGRACRPRVLNAVDSFALDMLPPLSAGAYAGYMGLYHLGFDRLAHLPEPADMFRGTAWPRVVWRILRLLAAGGELVLALGGGVPATARTCYAAREFVGRLYRERPGRRDPAALARGLKGRPGFEQAAPSGGLARSLRRQLEAWVLAGLLEGDGMAATRLGRLTEEGRRRLLAAADGLGWPAPAAAELVREFEEEFGRETPFRERFFRSLCARVAREGTPLLLLPAAHGEEGPSFGEAVCLAGGGGSGGLLRVLRADGSESLEPAGRFSRDFVRSRFL